VAEQCKHVLARPVKLAPVVAVAVWHCLLSAKEHAICVITVDTRTSGVVLSCTPGMGQLCFCLLQLKYNYITFYLIRLLFLHALANGNSPVNCVTAPGTGTFRKRQQNDNQHCVIWPSETTCRKIFFSYTEVPSNHYNTETNTVGLTRENGLNGVKFGLAEVDHERLWCPAIGPGTHHLQCLGNARSVFVLRYECRQCSLHWCERRRKTAAEHTDSSCRWRPSGTCCRSVAAAVAAT